MKTEGEMRVQVVHAWPDRYWSVDTVLPQGASAGDALAAARDVMSEAGIDASGLSLAVFGRAVDLQARLRDGDRLELLRPLQISPQQARTGRAAAARRGARK